jgi:hypothetical protein
MNRRWLFTGTAAALLAMLVYMFDHGRAASGLAAAYTVRDAGERALGGMISERGSPGGSEAPAEGPRLDLWAEGSRKAAASIHTPIFLGRYRVRAMEIAAREYADLTRMPPGTWLTLTQESAERRSRLDSAIATVETQLVSASTREEMRALSQGEITRISVAIRNAQAKLAPTPASGP